MVNDQKSNVPKDVALIFISDSSFIHKGGESRFKSELENNIKKITKGFTFENPNFAFKLSFNVVYQAKYCINGFESAEVALIKQKNGKFFSVELKEESSLIEGMSIDETQTFIEENVNLQESHHLSALLHAMQKY